MSQDWYFSLDHGQLCQVIESQTTGWHPAPRREPRPPYFPGIPG